MAMELRDYFQLQCINTLEAVQNMESLFGEALRGMRDGRLHEIIGQQREALHAEADNMRSLVSQLGKTRKKRKSDQQAANAEIVMVGRRWIGDTGRNVVDEYRIYIEQIPEFLYEVNAALLSEEAAHFNLGNYTGLIVIAKQLGDMDAAGLLQQNIDRETHVRALIEGSLWEIIGSLAHRERKAA